VSAPHLTRSTHRPPHQAVRGLYRVAYIKSHRAQNNAASVAGGDRGGGGPVAYQLFFPTTVASIASDPSRPRWRARQVREDARLLAFTCGAKDDAEVPPELFSLPTLHYSPFLISPNLCQINDDLTAIKMSHLPLPFPLPPPTCQVPGVHAGHLPVPAGHRHAAPAAHRHPPVHPPAATVGAVQVESS
jgi:hypothetical protein